MPAWLGPARRFGALALPVGSFLLLQKGCGLRWEDCLTDAVPAAVKVRGSRVQARGCGGACAPTAGPWRGGAALGELHAGGDARCGLALQQAQHPHGLSRALAASVAAACIATAPLACVNRMLYQCPARLSSAGGPVERGAGGHPSRDVHAGDPSAGSHGAAGGPQEAQVCRSPAVQVAPCLQLMPPGCPAGIDAFIRDPAVAAAGPLCCAAQARGVLWERADLTDTGWQTRLCPSNAPAQGVCSGRRRTGDWRGDAHRRAEDGVGLRTCAAPGVLHCAGHRGCVVPLSAVGCPAHPAQSCSQFTWPV